MHPVAEAIGSTAYVWDPSAHLFPHTILPCPCGLRAPQSVMERSLPPRTCSWLGLLSPTSRGTRSARFRSLSSTTSVALLRIGTHYYLYIYLSCTSVPTMVANLAAVATAPLASQCAQHCRIGCFNLSVDVWTGPT